MSPRRLAVGSAAAALAVAFALRVVAGLLLNLEGGRLRGFDFYGYMADNLLSGQGMGWWFYEGLGWKAANRGPLYPLLVAGVRWLVGMRADWVLILVQAAVGAFACLLPAWFARRWGGARAGTVALWLAALWPYSIVIDTGLVEHVVYAPLVLIATALALRVRDGTGAPVAVAAGMVAGVAMLARVTFGATVPLLALAALGKDIRFQRLKDASIGPQRAVGAFLLFGLGTVAALLPYAARNHAVTGSWTLGTDGGRALWVGNAEATFVAYPDRSIDETERELFRRMPAEERRALGDLKGDEPGQDREFRRIALRAIRDRPAACVWGALRKAAALWSPVNNPGPSGVAKLAVHGLTFVPLVIGVLAALAAVPRLRADLPVLAACAVSFTLVAAVFWGQSRYLAPLHGLALAATAAAIPNPARLFANVTTKAARVSGRRGPA